MERHPNLVRTYGVFNIVTAMTIGVVMEVCTCSLDDTRKDNGGEPAPMDTVAEFMRQILMGLAFLHAKKIIHRCPVVHASHDPAAPHRLLFVQGPETVKHSDVIGYMEPNAAEVS